MIFCTVTSNKHIFLAILMAQSIKSAHPDAKVVMGLVEKDFSFARPYLDNFDHVVLAKDLGFPNFNRHIFKHNEYDGPGSCKARLMKYAYNYFKDEEIFIYLDSDTFVYSPFDELKVLLNDYPILLSPHIISPNEEIELLLCGAGVFNSGLLAFRRSSETARFFDWWANRLDKYGYVDVSIGTYGDQKWLDQAPSLFHLHIIRDPGYNVAWWNLYERKLSFSDGGKVNVNGFPLKFVHFSGILVLKGKEYDDFLRTKAPGTNHPIYYLKNQYIQKLLEVGQNFSNLAPWSYSRFNSGELINLASRIQFRKNISRFAHIKNPFTKSNKTFGIASTNKRKPKIVRKQNFVNNQVKNQSVVNYKVRRASIVNNQVRNQSMVNYKVRRASVVNNQVRNQSVVNYRVRRASIVNNQVRNQSVVNYRVRRASVVNNQVRNQSVVNYRVRRASIVNNQVRNQSVVNYRVRRASVVNNQVRNQSVVNYWARKRSVVNNQVRNKRIINYRVGTPSVINYWGRKRSAVNYWVRNQRVINKRVRNQKVVGRMLKKQD